MYKKRRIATIDIGTNSILMVIAERDEKGHLKVLYQTSHVPKLGEGLRNTGKISTAAIDRAARALQECKGVAHRFEVSEIFLTATSATREASNRDQFVSKVHEETGMSIQVIPPNEEARLTYLSATSEQAGNISTMVVDIGGGSTEITWGLGARFDGGRSLNLGTVKLTDAYLNRIPPSKEMIEKARGEVDDRLSRVTPLSALQRSFGTAGSFTHLASIALGLEKYHPDAVQNFKITLPITQEWIERLSKMSREEIGKLKGVDVRRIDVLLSGTIIIERLLKKFNLDGFDVIDRGIRFGKLFDLLKGFVPPIEWGEATSENW